MDNLLGMELPLPVKLILAFIIVLVLIAIATWIFRRIGGNRLGTTTARGRQPRLAVIDAAAVDGRRRLVLVRRDNVEHLMMIGGPTDVVIEQNIVRAVPVTAPREQSGQRPSEPMARGSGEAPPRPPLDLARSPGGDASSRLQRPQPPSRAARSEPPPPRTVPRPPMSMRGEPEPAPVDVHQAPPTADTNLADMAHKLEAALRRPAAPRAPETAGATAHSEQATATGEAPPSSGPSSSEKTGAASQSKPAGGDTKPGAPKSMFDSLEEEMASLLGKPPAKP